MGKQYAEIDSTLAQFITSQPVFFVATAPLDAHGHVNCSPKGLGSLRVLDPHTVAYVDFTGSGVETIAHLRENGRIVLMFCAFEGPPKIVRIHGNGLVIPSGDAEFAPLLQSMAVQPEAGIRAIIRVDATRVSTSCGYAVPLLKFEQQREQLQKWADKKGTTGLESYKLEKNSLSIDGLPGLDSRSLSVQR